MRFNGMNTTFKEIDGQEVKETHPKLFREDILYYSILKDGEKAGFYGIIDRGNSIAETFITVFEDYKYKIINKNSIFYMMNRPFFLGFKDTWTWTRWKSWVKLLKRFEIEGVELQLTPPSWDKNDNTKIWFRKRK